MQGRIRIIVDGYSGEYQYGDYGDIPAAISANRITGYLFLSGSCDEPSASCTLMIAPFRFARNQRSYLLREPLFIDLRRLEPDHYQVHLVQDFWTDDDNADLSECLAGTFLGRRRASGEWEIPERWPIECRSLTVLGTVNSRQGRYVIFRPRCSISFKEFV